MIDAIKLRDLRNSTFAQFVIDFAAIVERNDATALSVQPQHEALLQKIDELQALFGNPVANPITAEVEALDLRRDRAVVGLVAIVNAYTYHRDTPVAQAATLLQSNLKRYGTNIIRESYSVKTTIIRALADELQSNPELTGALNLLNIAQWVDELQQSNEEFSEKYIDRLQDYAKASPENQKGKRVEVTAAYQELRKRLAAYAEIEGTELYAKTINELNALIGQYKV